MTERCYLILIERAGAANLSAYAPDLPGVVATGATEDECAREMRYAIALHLEGLRDAGEPVPEPSQLRATYVTVAA
jgi:predicted RNase H-like HicB family nuclease